MAPQLASEHSRFICYKLGRVEHFLELSKFYDHATRHNKINPKTQCINKWGRNGMPEEENQCFFFRFEHWLVQFYSFWVSIFFLLIFGWCSFNAVSMNCRCSLFTVRYRPIKRIRLENEAQEQWSHIKQPKQNIPNILNVAFSFVAQNITFTFVWYNLYSIFFNSLLLILVLVYSIQVFNLTTFCFSFVRFSHLKYSMEFKYYELRINSWVSRVKSSPKFRLWMHFMD